MSIAISAFEVSRIFPSVSGDVQALKQVSFRIDRGQFVALRGRSGSGKTTLLNCIGGLDQPTTGKLEVDGRDIPALSDEARTSWRRQNVGFVFQQMGLLATFSAYENLDLMARLGGLPRQQRQGRILECLERVGLQEYSSHRPYEMSGGQQQRIAIARALVASPGLILADEPTSELDSETTHDILDMLQRLVRDAGLTILLSSHDPIVDEYVDRVYYLRDGSIREEEMDAGTLA